MIPRTTSRQRRRVSGVSRGQGNERRAFRPSLEALEDRSLPSTTAIQVLDVNPGVASSNPSALTDVGGKLFFAANDGVHGTQLWSTRGSSVTTAMVKQINLNGDSNPANMVNINGILYFSATNGANGVELWRSGGTAASTVLVDDINPGTASSSPQNLTNFNGMLFFSATDGSDGVQLWTSDGTSTGTRMVKIINPLGDASPALFTVVGSEMFFRANDGTHGFELWETDGTSTGTQMVADINPTGSSNPTVLTSFRGKVFFAANDGVHGNELWESDGTVSGTHMVADINLTGDSNPGFLTVSNNTLFFAATDGVHGNQLWATDGGTNTFMVKQISATGDANPAALTDVNGTLYFRATDGTHGNELWRSDGTSSGTVMVKDILPGSNSSNPVNLTNFHGTLFFQANDGSHGVELWESDGTSAGTVMVRDIQPGGGGSNPNFLTVSGNVLYFSASTTPNGTELWRVISDIIVTGPGLGSAPVVNVFDAKTGSLLYSFDPYPVSFTGGVRIAVADVNGDGVPDIITAPGPGSVGPDVRIFDGATGTPIGEFSAYSPQWLGGVFVASADFNKDGRADILTGADAGGGPHVEVWSGADLSLLASFYAYTPTFTGGVRVAAGDVSGDGIPDIITAPGPGMPGEVRIFDGSKLSLSTGTLLHKFTPYSSLWQGGVYVAAGDMNGDGKADIITGAGAGGGPHVQVFDGATIGSGPDVARIASYYAYSPSFTGGVRVAFLGDLNSDGGPEVLTSAGPGTAQPVQALDNLSTTSLDSFFAYGSGATQGVFVGGSQVK